MRSRILKSLLYSVPSVGVVVALASLVTASAGPLSFSEVSISPHVARGLSALTPITLARLLMRDPYRVESKSAGREAAQ